MNKINGSEKMKQSAKYPFTAHTRDRRYYKSNNFNPINTI